MRGCTVVPFFVPYYTLYCSGGSRLLTRFGIAAFSKNATVLCLAKFWQREPSATHRRWVTNLACNYLIDQSDRLRGLQTGSGATQLYPAAPPSVIHQVHERSVQVAAKQVLTVLLFWHHWSARTNGCTAHKDPGCQGGVFGITTSGVRYYWSGVSCLSCQLSVCLVSKSLDRTNRSHSLLDIPALRPYRSSQGVSNAEGTIHMQIRSSVTPNTMSWGWTSTTATTWPKGGAETCA